MTATKTPTVQKDYFPGLQSALHAAGIAVPALIVDKAALDANLDQLIADLPGGMAYRIVVKSLPCPDLLAHVMKRTGTDRLMTFNAPMLIEIARRFPAANQMLGKPMPVAAARYVLETLREDSVDAVASIAWLIDTPERLHEYSELANDLDIALDIVLEIDVGMHRGGFVPGDALNTSLKSLRETNRLHLTGLMGYEPHLAKLPEDGGWRDRATKGAWNTYQSVTAAVTEHCGEAVADGMVRNGAGSPTYRLYGSTDIVNEVSVGSVLVKPTDFDAPLLTGHVPASFIAAPVLKVYDRVVLPGLEYADDATRSALSGEDKTLFTYGGKWMAKPVYPEGLTHNDFMGQSSNQDMLNGPADLPVAPGDFVFLRPKQSEAVFLQFGAIAVFEDDRISGHWPVFSASA